MLHHFSFPTDIRFGPGARHELREFLEAAGYSRPLLVTDRGLAPLPIVAELKSELSAGRLDVALFSDISGNPVEASVEAGRTAFHEHRADSIVGLGGGAALDVAKAIAVRVHHPGSLFDYSDGRRGTDPPAGGVKPANSLRRRGEGSGPPLHREGALPIDREIPFWVALPTTAGTGSEVGRSAVISDDSHIKRILFSPRLLARAVFADPELTLGLPQGITAATGMDAITHCIEAYLAKDYHPICDGIALEGLRLAALALPVCANEPSNLAARSDMLLASMMGAIAFQKGLGVTHSCAHALGTVADLHHGFANGVMLDHALEWNAPAVPEKFRILARTIELSDESASGFLEWVRGLKRSIGIPEGLGTCGIAKTEIDRLSTLAAEDGCHQNNPRPCGRADIQAIFERAFA